MVTNRNVCQKSIFSIFVYIGTNNIVCLVMPKVDVIWNKRAIINERKPSPPYQTKSGVILET